MASISQLAHSQWHPVLACLPHWSSLETQFSVLTKHGDLSRWLNALEQLPKLEPGQIQLNDVYNLSCRTELEGQQLAQMLKALKMLHPWRKGPFNLFGIHIDTEWRCDWKWERVWPHLAPLNNRTILDVGCGNGYYGWRMLQQGAKQVIGIDPTLIFLFQHLAIAGYAQGLQNQVLPLRLEDLPAGQEEFDSVFSMGVIYHCRDPFAHIEKLYSHLKPGGELVLETLVMPDNWEKPLIPADRYARMRNVWNVPAPQNARDWLTTAGFDNARIVDITVTSLNEQRSTQWMTFDSLSACLDPNNANLTIEGYPAPSRAVLLANKPQ